MEGSFFENLKAISTDMEDINFQRFATVTQHNGDTYNVREEGDDGTIHNDVLSLDTNIKVGDKVVLGFIDNSIYTPFILGSFNLADFDTGQVNEKSGLINLGLPANSSQHTINLKIDEKINQGGGGGSIIAVGSFTINSNGHLLVELPGATDNPYYIDSSGHLIYDTSNTHNGGLIV